MIYIKFSKTHDLHGTFTNVIELADDHALTDEEIEAIKQQQYHDWVTHWDEYVAKMANQG